MGEVQQGNAEIRTAENSPPRPTPSGVRTQPCAGRLPERTHRTRTTTTPSVGLTENVPWNGSKGRRMVNRWRASGLTVAEFARQQGIAPGRLFSWWRKLEPAAHGATGWRSVPSMRRSPKAGGDADLRQAHVRLQSRRRL